MLTKDLFEIISHGENSGVEFKRDGIRPEQLAKEIVALANHRGGMILIGVEDDKTISGIQRDDLENWVFDTVFAGYVHPMILPFYETVQVEPGKKVAIISFPEGTSKPYVLRNNDREEMIAGQRSPRNPLIVDILRDYGYVESRGMGVRTKVIPLMKMNNKTEPVFQATEDYLCTILHRKLE